MNQHTRLDIWHLNNLFLPTRARLQPVSRSQTVVKVTYAFATPNRRCLQHKRNRDRKSLFVIVVIGSVIFLFFYFCSQKRILKMRVSTDTVQVISMSFFICNSPFFFNILFGSFLLSIPTLMSREKCNQ